MCISDTEAGQVMVGIGYLLGQRAVFALVDRIPISPLFRCVHIADGHAITCGEVRAADGSICGFPKWRFAGSFGEDGSGFGHGGLGVASSVSPRARHTSSPFFEILSGHKKAPAF